MPPRHAFSICTLVTDHRLYAAMQESFLAAGFDAEQAEFLHLDNSRGNRWDAYRGVAELLARARGRHVLLCHQDIRLLAEGAGALAARLAELEARDPAWAVAGNAGVTPEGRLALRITDPHGADQRRGILPVRVASLDENFLVVRAEAGIRPSAELRGFHFYGTDLCLQARLAGRSAWVIDFHLHHLSPGQVDRRFLDDQERFEHHWGARLGRSERIRTTCAHLSLRAGLAGHVIAAWRLARHRRLRQARPLRGG